MWLSILYSIALRPLICSLLTFIGWALGCRCMGLGEGGEFLGVVLRGFSVRRLENDRPVPDSSLPSSPTAPLVITITSLVSPVVTVSPRGVALTTSTTAPTIQCSFTMNA